MGKAVATKALLQEQAMALFIRHGFDETTVAQIAGAAQVSQMTFFRYFPTKEAVVFDDPYDPVIADLIAAQNPKVPALERVRLGLRPRGRSRCRGEGRRRQEQVQGHRPFRRTTAGPRTESSKP